MDDRDARNFGMWSFFPPEKKEILILGKGEMLPNGASDHQAQPGPPTFGVRDHIYIGILVRVPAQKLFGQERSNFASHLRGKIIV
jgi:hypothetical protein